jgi:hypothetical protein
MGIDWWEHDPSLSSRAHGESSLARENQRLREEIEELKGARELTDTARGSVASRHRTRASSAAHRRRGGAGTDDDDG